MLVPLLVPVPVLVLVPALVLVLAETRRQIPSHRSNSGGLQSFHEDLIHEPQLLLLIRQEKMMEKRIFWRGGRREFFHDDHRVGLFFPKQDCDGRSRRWLPPLLGSEQFVCSGLVKTTLQSLLITHEASVFVYVERRRALIGPQRKHQDVIVFRVSLFFRPAVFM